MMQHAHAATSRGTEPSAPPVTALVLSGGGARGAYQAGVLRGLLENGLLPNPESPFDVYVGSSAGALNAGALAAHADRFDEGIAVLDELWRNIEADQVFRTDVRSLGSIGLRWVRDLSLGGVLSNVHTRSLLDTAPLAKLIEDRIPWERLDANVAERRIRALAITATDLHTSTGVVFLHAWPELPVWKRRRWLVDRVQIRAQHLLASSAIPVFFPPANVDGRYYGDGSIRNTTPLSPAINLGADRIVAIGVQGPTESPGPVRHRPLPEPSLAEIAGVLLDAVMLDSIEVDVEHSARVNTSVVSCPGLEPGAPFREVGVLWLSPSRSFGPIVSDLADRIPRAVHYLLRGLGPDAASTELISYLLFDPVFCGRLVELGRSDVHAERERIARFFERDLPDGSR